MIHLYSNYPGYVFIRMTSHRPRIHIDIPSIYHKANLEHLLVKSTFIFEIPDPSLVLLLRHKT